MYSKSLRSGFTLVEVLVTIAIFLFSTTVALFNYRLHSDVVQLNNSAAELEITVREAQVWAMASREYPPGSDSFDDGFGVYFNSSNPDQYIFFVDKKSNGTKDNKYTGSQEVCNNGQECITLTSIRTGYAISDICTGPDADNLTCGRDVLNIVFTRPNLGPVITADDAEYKYAKITLTSPKGGQKSVLIGSLGLITS